MPYAKEDARNRARLAATFKVWLASGVTSVVDIGGPFWNFEVREQARRSDAAPRVIVAGPLVSMVDRVKLDLGDPPIIKTTTVGEVVDLVRKEIDRKADYIKVWFIYRPGDDIAAQEALVKAAAIRRTRPASARRARDRARHGQGGAARGGGLPGALDRGRAHRR
jgi:hypothetical protein